VHKNAFTNIWKNLNEEHELCWNPERTFKFSIQRKMIFGRSPKRKEGNKQ
jgi:hypothetical protein